MLAVSAMSGSEAVSSQALDVLYQDHHGWLLGWLRRKTGCSEQAADLAQDTFLRLMTGRRAEMLEPRAYLTTVARRLMLDAWRRRDLERAYLEELAALPEALAPSAEDCTLVFEALARIDAALSALKPRTRRVFLLNQLDELSYDAIARQLDISRITVRRDMALAIRAICVATE